MTAPKLLAMYCTACQQPVPANPDEVVWVCPTCGQGLILSDTAALKPLQIHVAGGIPEGETGLPFWVVRGTATLERSTFKGNETAQMQQFWSQPRLFFIPALKLPLDQVLSNGVRLLRMPVELADSGKKAAFQPVVLLPEDLRPIAEFIVLALEAERDDTLRELQFEVKLEEPEFWVFPAGKK